MQKWEYQEVGAIRGGIGGIDPLQLHKAWVISFDQEARYVEPKTIYSYMAQLGREGWELVACSHANGVVSWTFKRSIQ